MKHLKYITSFFLLSTLASCGGTVAPTTTTASTATKYEFGTPTSFSVTSKDSGALISFAYNGAATGGYDIYFGTTSEMTGLGDGFITSPYHTTANSITFSDLTNGTTYYFAVVAKTSSGTASSRTTTASVVPAHMANQVEKVADVHMEVCFSKYDQLRFADGQLSLSAHNGGTSYPGQSGDCDIKGIRLHTTQDNGTYNRVIPLSSGAAWAPSAQGQTLDLALPGYVAGSTMTVTDLAPIISDCKGHGNKTNVHSDNDTSTPPLPNTIVLDGLGCDDDVLNFINGAYGMIHFTLHYMVDG